MVNVKTGLNVSLLDIDNEFEEYIAVNIKNFDNAGQDLMFVNMYRTENPAVCRKITKS